MHRRELISRRHLIAGCASLAGTVGLRCRAQGVSLGKPGTASGELPVHVVKNIAHAALVDASADSTQLCLYFSRSPIRSFTWNGLWEDTSGAGEKEDRLRVLECDSWNAIYVSRLSAPLGRGSFFADGKRLYIDTQPALGRDGATIARILIDLRTSKEQERTDTGDQVYFNYIALADNEILGTYGDPRNSRTEAIVKAELPSYREIERVPFGGPRGAGTGRTEGPLIVSADRSKFVYTYDRTVVCRRTSDLGVIWSRETDPSLTLWSATVSADASLAAAYICDYTGVGQARRRYVLIIDARDGREMTRVSADGLESLAVCAERQLLAVGERVPLRARTSGTQPTVRIFDINSGKQVAELIHDQLYGGGKEFLFAGVKSRFMHGGDVLITSGLNTRVWHIGRS